MFRSEALIKQIENDELFQTLSVPFSEKESRKIRDAEFLIRKDGLIVNIEGWNHPNGLIVGEVLYTPDEKGDKSIFNLPYRKVTLFQGTHIPIPYQERGLILSRIDPYLHQVNRNPYYARYKQLLPVSDFIAYLPSIHVFEMILQEMAQPPDQMLRDLDNALNLLGLDKGLITLGLTGAPLLGNVHQYHDLDLVFIGSLQQNKSIAIKMRDLLKQEKERRLFEGGKSWSIRFFNDDNHLMCNFFGYRDIESAPLRDFTMEVIKEDIEVEGTVIDDTHSMYTPSILTLADFNLKDDERLLIYDERKPRSIQLIVYHTASRGDCFNGDRVKAKGALVNIHQDGVEYSAVCSIEREAVKNLTPPWKKYYE